MIFKGKVFYNQNVTPGLDHLLAVVDALQPHPVEEVDIWNKIPVLKHIGHVSNFNQRSSSVFAR